MRAPHERAPGTRFVFRGLLHAFVAIESTTIVWVGAAVDVSASECFPQADDSAEEILTFFALVRAGAQNELWVDPVHIPEGAVNPTQLVRYFQTGLWTPAIAAFVVLSQPWRPT